MKKQMAMLLSLVLAFSLAACTQDSGQPEAAAPPAEEQLETLAANSAVWLPESEDIPAFYGVTDLDGNGWLELIRSQSGDSWDSTDAFFAVDKDGVKELAFPYGEEHSHPDLADHDDFRMYAGQDGKYLIVYDNIYLGPSMASDYQAMHGLEYLHLTGDTVEAGDIAWCKMQDEDTNGDGLSEYHIYYFRAGNGDLDLDGEGYVNSVSEGFGGYEEEVCHIAWWTPDSETEISGDSLMSGLSYSWQGYSVGADAETFGALITDPYYGFYAAGAGGPHIYLADEEVPYFPSYWDIKGTWYLQSAWTDAGVTYLGTGLSAGELDILKSGQLYMNYSNENDPRGPYLITGMNMTRDSRAEGTDTDDWVIVYESDDGMWQMELRPDPDRDMLYVTWYEWPDGDRSAEPTGVNLEYSRVAG